MADKEMSAEQILRWLIEFGSDWVVFGTTLKDTWAMREIGLTKAEAQGDLKSNININDGEPWKMKLTEKALARLDDGTNP